MVVALDGSVRSDVVLTLMFSGREIWWYTCTRLSHLVPPFSSADTPSSEQTATSSMICFVPRTSSSMLANYRQASF